MTCDENTGNGMFNRIYLVCASVCVCVCVRVCVCGDRGIEGGKERERGRARERGDVISVLQRIVHTKLKITIQMTILPS